MKIDKKLSTHKGKKFLFTLLAYEIFIFGFCVLLSVFLLVMGAYPTMIFVKDKELLNIEGKMIVEADTPKQCTEKITTHPIHFPYPLSSLSIDCSPHNMLIKAHMILKIKIKMNIKTHQSVFNMFIIMKLYPCQLKYLA
jgi:hypothetical protein